MNLSDIEEQFDQRLTNFFALSRTLVEEKKTISLIRREDRTQTLRLTEFIRSYGDIKKGGGDGEVKAFFLVLFLWLQE